VPLTLTAVAGVDIHETGLASALLNTAQQVGGALGLAILATIAIASTKNKLAAVHGHISATANAIATTHAIRAPLRWPPSSPWPAFDLGPGHPGTPDGGEGGFPSMRAREQVGAAA